MENPTHKWKNDQISKNSKIRLKCRMKLIFGCWLGWGIVFFKKIILEPLGHTLRSIRNIWWDHEKWWKITKMTGFQRSARNWRAPARAPEYSKTMNPHLSIALFPMFIAFLDRLIRKVPRMHEITHKIYLSSAEDPFDWRISIFDFSKMAVFRGEVTPR